MKEQFKTIDGTLQLLGNAVSTSQAKNYTVIELVDPQGKRTTLQNVAVSNMLDNYLQVGSKVELKLVDGKIFSKVFSNVPYIYGVKPEGRNTVGFLPNHFTRKKNISLILGVVCMLTIWAIPLGIYFLWKASKQSKALKLMNNEIGN